MLDLRYPIGFLLTTYGAMLALRGLIAPAMVMGLNVNLSWGAVMIIAGLVALILAKRGV